jgi:hypothetical protein
MKLARYVGLGLMFGCADLVFPEGVADGGGDVGNAGCTSVSPVQIDLTPSNPSAFFTFQDLCGLHPMVQATLDDPQGGFLIGDPDTHETLEPALFTVHLNWLEPTEATLEAQVLLLDARTGERVGSVQLSGQVP